MILGLSSGYMHFVIDCLSVGILAQVNLILAAFIGAVFVFAGVAAWEYYKEVTKC